MLRYEYGFSLIPRPLRGKIQELVRDVTANATHNPADAVYQLNVQFFALTKPVVVAKEKEQARSLTA